MPELPEVEAVRRSLQTLEGVILEEVTAPDPQVQASLREALQRDILSIGRRGKYLVFDMGDRNLVVHLGMSGRLFITTEALAHPHRRWSFRTSNATYLNFVDRRRFGRFRVVTAGVHAFPGMETLGPEPLDRRFGSVHLRREANNTTRSIKSVLLDQSVVAGLGNIYVDEALYAAGIHPVRVGLGVEEARRLSAAIKRILRAAVAQQGSSFSLHRDGLVEPGKFTMKLRVFGRAGQPCECGSRIVKFTHLGRGTHVCPRCQQGDQRRAPRRLNRSR